MTLTFDLMTLNVLVHLLSRDQTMYHILDKPKNPWRNSPEAFFMRGLARNYLGIYSPFIDPWPDLNFLCLPRSLLSALTSAFGTCRQSSKTLRHSRPSRHPKV